MKGFKNHLNAFITMAQLPCLSSQLSLNAPRNLPLSSVSSHHPTFPSGQTNKTHPVWGGKNFYPVGKAWPSPVLTLGPEVETL